MTEIAHVDLVYGDEKLKMTNLNYPINIKFDLGTFVNPIYSPQIKCGFWDITKTEPTKEGSFVPTSKAVVNPEHFLQVFGLTSSILVDLYKVTDGTETLPGYSTAGCAKLYLGQSLICRCNHLTEITPIVIPPPTSLFVSNTTLYPNIPESARQRAKSKLNVYDLKIPRTGTETIAFLFMIIYTTFILCTMIVPLMTLCNKQSNLMPPQLLFYYPYLSEIFKRKIMKSHAKLLENLQNIDGDDEEFIVGKKGGLYKQSKYELNFDKIRKLYKNENIVPEDLRVEVLPENVDFAEIIDLMANRAKVKEIKGPEDLRFLRLQNDRFEEESNRKKIVSDAKKARSQAIEEAQKKSGKNDGDEGDSEIKKYLEKQLYRAKMKIKAAESRLDIIHKRDVSGLKKMYRNPFFDGVGPVSGTVRKGNNELKQEAFGNSIHASDLDLNSSLNSRGSRFNSIVGMGGSDSKKGGKNGKDKGKGRGKDDEEKNKRKVQLPIMIEEEKPVSEIELLYGPYWNPDVTEYDMKLAVQRLSARRDIPDSEKKLFTTHINPLKISVEYDKFIKRDVPEVLAAIKGFEKYKENNFLQDKYDLGTRFSIMRLFLLCNPFFTMYTDYFSLLSPKWYRAIYWYYFAMSHAFAYCFAFLTMMDPPLERDSGILYSFTQNSFRTQKIILTWSIALVGIVIINTVVAFIYYPGERSLMLRIDRSYAFKIL